MARPTISVVMPNFNHSKYLPESLPAILNQSYQPLELLIIDDASTDDSVEIIEGFAKKHANIRFYRNSSNMGPNYSANKLYGLAGGDFIYSASADDRILPGFFEKSVDVLSRFPQAALCFSDPATFVTGQQLRENRMRLSTEPRYFSPDSLAETLRRQYFFPAGHTSLIKRTLFLGIGALKPELKWHSDWLLWLVLAFRHGACYVPEPLASIRLLPSSYSSVGIKRWKPQVEVLTALLDAVQHEYKDVLPLIERSCVLGALKAPLLSAVVRNPQFWHYLSLRLVGRAVWREMASLTPEPLKRAVKPLHRES